MLGHASAAMTLDIYAGLFLDAVAASLDLVARTAALHLRDDDPPQADGEASPEGTEPA